MKLKLSPRSYQLEAAEKAFKERCATLVLPTGTGKTLVGLLWLSKIWNLNPRLRVLVLEPTRILVEQVANYYREIAGLEPVKIYGILPKHRRAQLWKTAKIVISTPETAYNDLEFSRDFEVLIIDECHHAIGQDPLLKFLKESNAEWRLGLSAFIPRKYRSEISLYIGKIIEWTAQHPEIRKYIPQWIGEVYEAWFTSKEMELYRAIEKLYLDAKDAKKKMLLRLALKFYSRDGLLALRETYHRSTHLKLLLNKLEDKIFDNNLRELHKLETLQRILNIYDFEKAIIFVDRLIVAERLYTILTNQGFKVVVIKGKAHLTPGESFSELLHQARNPSTQIVISTSAGEEGVDLPDADLLVIWSNISQPLRFIQRHGRILRKTKEPKYATYIVTPETIDLDMLIDALELTKRYMDIPLDPKALRKLRRYSPRKKLFALLETPMPIEWIQKLSGMTLSEVRRALKLYLESGELFYIYTHLGKTYFTLEHLTYLYENLKDYVTPQESVKLRIKFPESKRTLEFKNYKEAYEKLVQQLPLAGLRIVSVDSFQEVERYHFLSYEFLIPSKTILKLVLANATSKATLEIY
jgi:ERCC4-related helicase